MSKAKREASACDEYPVFKGGYSIIAKELWGGVAFFWGRRLAGPPGPSGRPHTCTHAGSTNWTQRVTKNVSLSWRRVGEELEEGTGEREQEMNNIRTHCTHV